MEINSEHIGEERLEAYAMNRVGAGEAATIEEHLLICTTCQDELDAVEQYVRAMQGAAKRVRQEQPRTPETAGAWARLLNWFNAPARLGALASAGVAILALIAFMGPRLREQRPGPPIDVDLQAVRGQSSQLAPTGHAIHLHLDARGVSETRPLPIEIVDEVGSRVWNGTGFWSGTTILTAVDRSFKPGTYFVRLLKDGPDPIREYQLIVQ